MKNTNKNLLWPALSALLLGAVAAASMLPHTYLLDKQQSEQTVAAKMGSLERDYRIHFAKQGETVERVETDQPDCTVQRRDMVYARLPDLPELKAIEQALMRSWPSQLTADGKDGVKIYFLDRQIVPAATEGRPTRGMFIRADKDGHRALYITPDGAKATPTANEGTEPRWSLTWIIMHELTHNGQTNVFGYGEISEEIAHAMGWQQVDPYIPETAFLRLRGKNGELYAHARAHCAEPPAWFTTDREGRPVDAAGQVSSIQDAAHITGKQLMDLASIRPATFYFVNPLEMLAEALTAYRAGRESRNRLRHESPTLYAVVHNYDQQELSIFYGTNADGASNTMRSPDGFVVARNPASESALALFEQE